MGRALVPEQSVLPDGRQDAIYPYLVSQMDVPGLKGLVVAGIFAAALSTYDSIGSSLSALLTRDVYARLLVRDRDDRHYLRVGQWLTALIIGLSFLYVPFLLQYCGHFSSEFSDDKSRNLIKKNTHVNLCFLNKTQEIKLTLILKTMDHVTC
jgi:Na+/proline symporter